MKTSRALCVIRLRVDIASGMAIFDRTIANLILKNVTSVSPPDGWYVEKLEIELSAGVSCAWLGQLDNSGTLSEEIKLGVQAEKVYLCMAAAGVVCSRLVCRGQFPRIGFEYAGVVQRSCGENPHLG